MYMITMIGHIMASSVITDHNGITMFMHWKLKQIKMCKILLRSTSVLFLDLARLKELPDGNVL